METIIFRESWLLAANKLNDKQYREFVSKVAYYGLNECREEISSKDEIVNVMLEMVKPSIKENVSKYLGY